MTRAAEAGYTLVEVLFALLLMALAVLAAAPMFVYAMQGNAAGADLGTAAALASERMELLRSADFASLVDGGSLDADVAGYSDGSTPAFAVRWRISAGTVGPPDAKTIEVRVIPQRVGTPAQRKVDLLALRCP